VAYGFVRRAYGMGDVDNTLPVDRRASAFPLTTGAGAALLGTTEPRLAETVRRGHVSPPPPILAGRRLWSAGHLMQAALALDLMTDDLRVVLAAESA
jgi:hypothetical protein